MNKQKEIKDIKTTKFFGAEIQEYKIVNKQPTEAQIKGFWERCGFEWHDLIGLWNDPIHGLISSVLPPIDLNNLFKYAVPKLQWFIVEFEHIEVSCDYYVTLTDFYLAKRNKKYKSINSDPALALFWALWQVKEAK